MTSTDPPQRILLVRLSHLGDVVHALPIYSALRAKFPSAALAWAVQPEFADLVEGLPGIDRVLSFDRRGGLRAWWRLRKELVAYAPDWTIDAQGNAKSASVTLLSGARRRSGWHASDWTEPVGALALNDRASRTAGASSPHAVDRARHLAAHLIESTLEDESLEARLPISSQALQRGRDRFAADFPDKASTVILQLAAAGDVRAWPTDHQREFLRVRARAGAPTLVLSGPGEAELGRRMATEFAGAAAMRHWVEQRGLRELAGYFHAAAERGATFVGCDSGPLHLAAACGLPVLCLSGPQDPRRTGPWPVPGADSPHRVLRSPESLYCAPCLSRQCGRPEGILCMEGISAHAVATVLAFTPPNGR